MLKRVVALVLAVLPTFPGRLLAAGGALMAGSAWPDTLKSASDVPRPTRAPRLVLLEDSCGQ